MRFVKFEKDGNVARIIFNRPEVGNAFNGEMLREIKEIAEKLASDDDLRVVILEGEGKHFCTGGDLRWMREMARSEYSENYKDALLLFDTYAAVENIPVPTIAKVKGAVRGGGLGFVSACDIAISAKSSTFSFSEVKIGMVPSVVSSFAIRKIGYRNARRLFLTAEIFDAYKAKEINLIDEVVDDESLDGKVDEIVKLILSNKPMAVRKTKELLRFYKPYFSENFRELTAHILATTRMGREALEGFEDFLKGKG